MPWFRVDDNLAFHAKVVEAGNAAMGLWVRAGSWSMQQLSDGFVPTHVARQLGKPAEIKRLVTSALWLDGDGGYYFHDWAERQPSRADVMRVAEKKGMSGAHGNHIRWHRKRGVLDPDCKWCIDGQEDDK